MLDQLVIRSEYPDDADAVHALLKAAFSPDDPAVPLLVDELRRRNRLRHALVAEVGGVLIGYAAATEAWVEHGTAAIAAIAPVAVVPAFQGRGVGQRLMDALLQHCRDEPFDIAVVLGDPAYYARFGFCAASSARLHCTWTNGPEFQVLALADNALTDVCGLVEYDPCFNDAG